jgi:hypothetical protein
MSNSPSLASLLAQIQSAIGPSLTPSLTTASAGSDVFEAYVLSIIIDAAEIEGAAVSFRNIDGSTPTLFTFRTSPGHIWWDSQPYTYAQIQFPGVPLLEAHLGVYVTGKSGLIHEADALVLLSEEATLSRLNQVPPRSKRALLAAECKFYAANLRLGLARAFVGLCSDLSSRECFFVTNSSSISVEKLLTHQRKKWQSLVEPSRAVDVLRFQNSIQDAFKDFKTQNAS